MRLAFTSVSLPRTGGLGVLPISDQMALILCAFADLAFQARALLAEVQAEVLCESTLVSLLSTSLHLDVKPQVVTVIEDDCNATTFQCRSAQERFAHAHHVKCDLDQNSSTRCSSSRVRQPFFVHMLQCHVVRCHSLNVCRTHHWKLRCKTRVDRHVQNIQNRSSTRAPQSCNRTDLPNSPCADVSCCLPARISRVPHLRIQSCSLETNLIAVQTFGVQVSSTCLLLSLSLISVTLYFDFPEPLPLP